MPAGDPIYFAVNTASTTGWSYNSNLVWDNNLITVSGVDSSRWNFFPIAATAAIAELGLHVNKIQEHITNVLEALNQINQRYHIFDPNFKNCEVLASKMFFNQIPKGLCELGISAPINGKRNVFLIVKIYEGSEIVESIVDICASQYGGINMQPCTANLALPWIAEFRYKNPTSLVKRLIKEGRLLKELSLKDAIALSTRYTVSGTCPSQMDIHLINPDDAEGRKFLEKFGKEVGFKTTLAQLLLDQDPIVAEKARSIAQIILQR